MDKMWYRIAIVIVAIPFLHAFIEGVAHVVGGISNYVTLGIGSLFTQFSMGGRASIEGLVKLCLSLVGGIFLLKFLFKRPN